MTRIFGKVSLQCKIAVRIFRGSDDSNEHLSVIDTHVVYCLSHAASGQANVTPG